VLLGKALTKETPPSLSPGRVAGSAGEEDSLLQDQPTETPAAAGGSRSMSLSGRATVEGATAPRA